MDPENAAEAFEVARTYNLPVNNGSDRRLHYLLEAIYLKLAEEPEELVSAEPSPDVPGQRAATKDELQLALWDVLRIVQRSPVTPHSEEIRKIILGVLL